MLLGLSVDPRHHLVVGNIRLKIGHSRSENSPRQRTLEHSHLLFDMNLVLCTNALLHAADLSLIEVWRHDHPCSIVIVERILDVCISHCERDDRAADLESIGEFLFQREDILKED